MIFYSYLKLNDWYYITVICSICIVAAYIQQEYMVIPQLENMPVFDNVLKAEILERFQRLRWLSLLIAPIIIILRASLVAVCFFIGSQLFDNFNKLRYSRCFNVALKADIILFSATIISCIILILFSSEYTIYVSKYTSLLYFLDLATTEPWLISSIGIFNVFEIAYWFFLAVLIAIESKKIYKEALNFVICTYGTGLIFYILLIIFITLYISQ